MRYKRQGKMLVWKTHGWHYSNLYPLLKTLWIFLQYIVYMQIQLACVCIQIVKRVYGAAPRVSSKSALTSSHLFVPLFLFLYQYWNFNQLFKYNFLHFYINICLIAVCKRIAVCDYKILFKVTTNCFLQWSCWHFNPFYSRNW